MSGAADPEPSNPALLEAEVDFGYAEAIHEIGSALDTADAREVLHDLPRLRGAAAAADDAPFVAEVDRIAGVLTARIGDHARGRALLDSAHHRFCSEQEWELAALALADAAEIDYRQGEVARAARLYRQASDLAAREPDPALEDAAHYSGFAAQCHLESGDASTAIENYRAAVNFAVLADHAYLAATWSHDLAHVLERTGEAGDAIAAWSHATELDPDGTGGVATHGWSRLSETYRDHGLTEQARDAAARALTTAYDTATQRAARLQSISLRAESEPGEASVRDLHALRAEFLAARNRRDAACCDAIEAGIAFRAGRVAEAARVWDKAAAALADENAIELLAGLHADRASKLGEARDNVAARDHFERARKLYQAVGRDHDADTCAQNILALGASDYPDPIRTRGAAVRRPATRQQAHELLREAGVEYGFHRFHDAADAAGRALDFFARQGLREAELEARLLLAAVHAGTGHPDQTDEHLTALLAATAGGMYPTVRAQALIIAGTLAARRGKIHAAATVYREAVSSVGGDAFAAGLARLHLAAVTAETNPEQALRHARAASELFGQMRMVSLAGRADLTAAMALSRLGAWRGAFDLAIPALLVLDVLRAALVAPSDRDRIREVWSFFHDRVLGMLAELDDPRLTAEVLERFRANATVPAPKPTEPTPESGSGLATLMADLPPAGLPLSASPEPAVVWDAQWSAGAALLSDSPAMAIGLPPLVGMPWGVALQPYETIARQRLLAMPDRHRAPRTASDWAEQTTFE